MDSDYNLTQCWILHIGSGHFVGMSAFSFLNHSLLIHLPLGSSCAMSQHRTLCNAHSLCYNFTVDSQPSPGEPWCVVQGQVDGNVFLSYDCGAAKIQSTSLLGEEVKSMNTWEIQTETLRVIGNFLKGQLSDVILEKHMARGEPSDPEGKMTCWSEENGHIGGSWQFGLNGQMCLLFDSENGRWSMDRSGWSHMKEKWENDRAVTNFLKRVSMGHCQAWLQDFMVPWEEMLKSTDLENKLWLPGGRDKINKVSCPGRTMS
ncbi:hypothetical protein FD754_025386, partial [Muntiacus muntjak]